MSAAVYKIVNQKNGKIYIGSSTGVEHRLRQHRSELDRGIHHNRHLQRAWNRYGAESFLFEIVEEVDEDNLLKAEQLWIDMCRESDAKVYNIAPIAGSCRGVKRTEEARVEQSIRKREYFQTEAGIRTRQQISNLAKTRVEHLKNMLELSRTEECRSKQSISAKKKCQSTSWQNQQQKMIAARLTPEGRLHNAQAHKKLPIMEILEAAATGISHDEIGRMYGCTRSSVENTIHFKYLGGIEVTPYMEKLSCLAIEHSKKRIVEQAKRATEKSLTEDARARNAASLRKHFDITTEEGRQARRQLREKKQKVTFEQAEVIRQRVASGERRTVVAKDYGITVSTVRNIILHKFGY